MAHSLALRDNDHNRSRELADTLVFLLAAAWWAFNNLVMDMYQRVTCLCCHSSCMLLGFRV